MGQVRRVGRPLAEIDVLVDERLDVVEPFECRVERFVARDKVEGKEGGIASDKGEFLQAWERASDDRRASPLCLHEGERTEIRGDSANQRWHNAIVLFVEALLAGLHVLCSLLKGCEPFDPRSGSRAWRTDGRSGCQSFAEEGKAEVSDTGNVLYCMSPLLLEALEEFFNLGGRVKELNGVETSGTGRIANAF